MLKNLYLKKGDVLDYLGGRAGLLATELNKTFDSILASESADFDKDAQFQTLDAKLIVSVIDEVESRIDTLKAMTLGHEAALPGWLKEILFEDRRHLIKEFETKINNAQTVQNVVKIIDDIDEKVDEIKETLEDETTFNSFLRGALKVGGVAAGFILNPIAGIAALGVALHNNHNIDKAKSLLRQVQNELMTLRRKAIQKRDQIRRDEYSTKDPETGRGEDYDSDMGDESFNLDILLEGSEDNA